MLTRSIHQSLVKFKSHFPNYLPLLLTPLGLYYGATQGYTKSKIDPSISTCQYTLHYGALFLFSPICFPIIICHTIFGDKHFPDLLTVP